METELKPCPFCGGIKAECGTIAALRFTEKDSCDYEYDNSHYSVVCDYTRGGCGASIGEFYDSQDEAVEAWNRRAEDDRTGKILD